MRITVDIEEGVLDDLVKLTGETKRSPAVAKAVEDFVRRQKLKEFGRLIRQGAFADAFPADYDPDKPGLLAAEDPAPYRTPPASSTPPDGPR
jgi:hypothetical protein